MVLVICEAPGPSMPATCSSSASISSGTAPEDAAECVGVSVGGAEGNGGKKAGMGLDVVAEGVGFSVVEPVRECGVVEDW